MGKSQTALSRQHPWLPGRIGATTAISVSAALTRLDIGVMIFHAFVVASWKMVGTRNAVQLPTQQPAVGKKRLRPIRRSLRTPLFRLHGSGASTVVGIRVLSAGRTTLAVFVPRITSFIVATIMDTMSNVMSTIDTVLGGVRCILSSWIARLSAR